VITDLAEHTWSRRQNQQVQIARNKILFSSNYLFTKLFLLQHPELPCTSKSSLQMISSFTWLLLLHSIYLLFQFTSFLVCLWDFIWDYLLVAFSLSSLWMQFWRFFFCVITCSNEINVTLLVNVR
jgi:hypothetical protein